MEGATDIAPSNSGLPPAGVNLRRAVGGVGENGAGEGRVGERAVAETEGRSAPGSGGKTPPEPEQAATQGELREIQKLAKRDREVRAHEQAHSSVGGRYAGNPSYQYQRGSNGVSYAVGGHVAIDVSSVPGDPAATLQKMITVHRAALAPQRPSPQDRAVAAKASQQAADARLELAELRLEASYGQLLVQQEPGKVVDVSV